MEQYASIQQLKKKESGAEERKNIYPPTPVQAVFDAKTGASLEALLAQMNNIYVPYQGTPYDTRNIIPLQMRRAGLTITYMDMEGSTITERASNAVQKDNGHWGLDTNWSRIDELSLSGDISVSAQGTWIINGEDTGITARGPKGDTGLTPWLKTVDNKLHYSYDNETWEVCSESIAAWFRWSGNKIQISRDNKTWTDLSGVFADNVHIKGYVADYASLPTNAAQGDIYGVGPTYADTDTEQTNPIYRYYVKNESTWVDNGVFTSIAAGVVQETGDSETEVMSQKAVTEELSELFPIELPQNLNGYIDINGEYVYGKFSGLPFHATDFINVNTDDIVEYLGVKESASVCGMAVYDDSKTFIKNVILSNSITHIKYIVEEGVSYIRCCSSYLSITPQFILHKKDNLKDYTSNQINEIKNHIGTVDFSVYKVESFIWSNTSNAPLSFFDYEYVKIPVSIGDIFAITATTNSGQRYCVITQDTDGNILTTEYANESLVDFEYTVQNNGYLIINNYRATTIMSVKVLKRFNKDDTFSDINKDLINTVFRTKHYDKNDFSSGYYALVSEDNYPPRKYNSDNSYYFSVQVKKGDIIVLKNTTGVGNIVPYALYDSTEGTKYEVATPNINKTYNYEQIHVTKTGIAAFNTPITFLDEVEITHYQQSLNILEEKWVDSQYYDIVEKLNNENRPDDEVGLYTKPNINAEIDFVGKSIKTVNIYNQEELDNLNLSSLLIDDVVVVLNIFEGTYLYKDLINLDSYNCPNTSILIQAIGNVIMIGSDCKFSLQNTNAVIRDGVYYLPYNETVSVNKQVFTDGKTIVEYADLSKTAPRKIYQSDNIGSISKDELSSYLNEETINNIPETHNVFMIECAELKGYSIEESYNTGASILCSKNYEAVYCNIYKMNDGVMIVSSSYNLLEDKNIYASNPSFRLYNAFNETEEPLIQDGVVKIPLKYNELYLCREGKFISVENSSFDKLVVRGIHFLGSADNVIRLNNTATFNAVSIKDNIFEGCKYHAVQTRVSNIEIKNNVFKNNFKNCILMNIEPTEIDVYFENIIIENNIFENSGLDMSNFVCIKCNGNKYYISGNKLVDFGYMGIGVGLWVRNQNTSDIIGVIEKNTLEYTDTYVQYISRYAVYDGGAIYTWTKNKNTIIRFNTIFNYKNKGAGRGIFLDDGTKGVSVYGNIIGSNWNSYSIDLRTVNSAADYVPEYNSRNFCGLNIVDAKVRWEGKAGDNTTICSSNIYVGHDNITEKDVTYSVSEEDSVIVGNIERTRVVLTQNMAAKIFNIKGLDSFVKSRVFRYY